MPMHPHALLLLPAVALGLACARPDARAPRRVALRGTVLGADGRPLPSALVCLWTDPYHPHVQVRTGPDGTFSLEARLKPGVYTLEFSAPGYPGAGINEAPFWVDQDRSFRLQARLGAYRLAPEPRSVELEARDDQGRATRTPMARQTNGTWAADVQAGGRQLRCRIFGAAELVEGVPYRFGVGLPGARTFELQPDRSHAGLVDLEAGRACIVFDPAQLPKGDPSLQLAFEAKDGDLEAAWRVAQARERLLDAQQPRPHKAGEDRQATRERLQALRRAQVARWEAELARETRPRVRKALGDALLLFAREDASAVLKAFAPGDPFWAEVDRTIFAVALSHARPSEGSAVPQLALLALDRREAEDAASILRHVLRPTSLSRREAILGDLARLRPGHPALQRLRQELKAEQARLAPGRPFPAFQLPDLEAPGRILSLDTFKGKWLLVDVWAVWCSSCVKELPGLHRAYAHFKGRGLELLSLSFDAQPRDIQDYRQAQRMPMPWKHAWLERGAEHPFAKALGVTAIPRVFLVGPDGTIRAMDEELHGAALEATLARLLPKA